MSEQLEQEVISAPEKELNVNSMEDLKVIIEALNKNDQILQSRIVEAFTPLFQKIAEVEYKLEMLSRLEEKLFIKHVESSKEYVQKITLKEYADLAKVCKRELDADVERVKNLKSN